MINVTKAFLPPYEDYCKYINTLWDTYWLTNNGPFAQELESKLKDYLGVKRLKFTSNGTIAIQIAIKALNIKKKIITTPFSYVATSGAIIWENCVPVFADIDPLTLCIDPKKVEQAIDEDTEAILATHVFGYPCDVDSLEELGKKHGIKIIYDGAHAFGSVYKGRSVLDYGDVSTCSFHATKLFHTIEGGCVITHSDDIDKEVGLKRSFGHFGDTHITLGINGKNSEFHAAMGLSILPYFGDIVSERKNISEYYNAELKTLPVVRPSMPNGLEYNYAYYPIVFESEKILLRLVDALGKEEIVPRRYFWPSLNKIDYINGLECPVSEDMASRILCLPLFNGLSLPDQERVIHVIKSVF